MSNKKKPPKDGKNAKGEQLYRCGFPNCGSIFAKEPGKPNACIRHRQLIEDVLFILNHLGQPEEEKPQGPATDQGPLLFVPKPGMADLAIEEAKRAQGQGPNERGN